MITQARSLWATGGKLGINPLDRVKYMLSWGLSSRHLYSPGWHPLILSFTYLVEFGLSSGPMV